MRQRYGWWQQLKAAQDVLDRHDSRLSDFYGVRLLMDDMNLTDSLKFLRDYADRGDEAAFRKLVEHYIDFVYSIAIRRVNGDASLAQDVTQTVFADLARKAKSLRGVTMLGGWLHRHTGFVASNLLRSEYRRQIREKEAVQMNETPESPNALWQQLAPVLDDTIESLEPPDRQAVLLRFFERQDFRTIGAALGISDDAAQKRVSRALEKLRALLTERGVTLSMVILSGFLAGRVIAAAPAELAANVARLALSGAAGGGMGLALLNLTRSLVFKVVAGVIVVASGIWFYSQHRSLPASGSSQPSYAAAPSITATNPPAMDIQSTAVASASQGGNAMHATTNFLLLNVVAADSGKPVPDVELVYTLKENGKLVHTTLQTTRFGVCKVPLPADADELELISERDGFATTMLDWRPDRGEPFPAQYTLQLARAVPISGTVVDPDGNPVAGAQASFDVSAPAASQMSPQTDNFAWHYDATTDAQGHWQIDRMGSEAVKNIHGWATDPNFADSPFVIFVSNAGAEKQLLAGTYVFKLEPGVVVKGFVKNQDGQPVPNANVLAGHAYQPRAARAKTRSDGSFSVVAKINGEDLITAEADGYGATTIQADFSNNSGPYTLVLRPGKLLRLRVVDENGKPVPRADVILNPLRDDLMDINGKAPPPVELRFRKQTDASGCLEWSNAPDRELNFIVNADGYMVNRGVNVQPDGIEHVVKLQTGLTVFGTVTDATTGQPIPRFRVIAGWPERGYFNGPTLTEDASRPHWSSFKRDWHRFGNGKFHFSYQSPMVLGMADPSYLFKFEADGYAPFVTRIVKATENSVRFDVTLTPAATTEITVISPEQKVVAGVDVGFVSQGAALLLLPGGLSHETVGGGDQSALVQTDSRGAFALPSDPNVTEVVAANAQGYVEATPAALAANPIMQLQPWGRLEGTLLYNGQPLADKTLSIGFGQGSRLYTINCSMTAFQTKTDSEGRFVMPQVPIGNHEITIIRPFTNDMGQAGSAETSLQSVTISPDGTTTVTLDTAKMDLPDFMRERFGLGGTN